MSEKMSWTELRKAVAKRIGTTEKEAALFLNALVPAIKEGLQQDGTVRINGLGTLSLKEMAPRKSVNVNTGEQITIPGYKKVTFTAEAAMRDTLDHVKIDPIQKLGEQAIEIMGIIGELKEMEKGEAPIPSVPDTLSPKRDDVAKGKGEEEKQEEKREEEKREEKKPAISRPWLTAGITVLCFAAVLAGGFLFAGYQFKNWVEGLHQKVGAEAPIPSVPDTLSPKRDEVAKGKGENDETSGASETSENRVDSRTNATIPDLSETLATVELNQDSRLAWLSYKHYGTKDLWVIIYEANKDVLPSPHKIAVGTPIRIPKLSEEWLDMNRPETRAVVDSLKEIWERK